MCQPLVPDQNMHGHVDDLIACNAMVAQFKFFIDLFENVVL